MSVLSTSVRSSRDEVDQPDGEEWIRLFSPLVTKKTAENLKIQWVKRGLCGKAEALFEITDHIISDVDKNLRRLSKDSPLPEGEAWIEVFQTMEGSFLRHWRNLNNAEFKKVYGIRWTNKLAKQMLFRAEKANDMICKITLHNGIVAANSVESAVPLTASEIVDELGL